MTVLTVKAMLVVLSANTAMFRKALVMDTTEGSVRLRFA